MANGCDGCLNPDGMINESMLTYFNTDKNKKKGPDITNTNNNGLLFTADVLEEIYTNPDFPPKAPRLAFFVLCHCYKNLTKFML